MVCEPKKGQQERDETHPNELPSGLSGRTERGLMKIQGIKSK
jgi:hypothetical protein